MKHFLIYICCLGVLPSPVWADVRAFMATDGTQSEQPASGPTSLTMFAGETVRVMVWMEDTNNSFQELNAYQILMPMMPDALGAAGTVSYVDNNAGKGGGDSILIDTTRDDFAFSEALVILEPVYNETPVQNYFGCIYNSIPGLGTVVADTGVRYLFEFEYTASKDACGMFEARFRLSPKAPPLSALFVPGGAQFFVDAYQPLIIDVICPECDGEPCDDRNACTINDVCIDIECIGERVDCTPAGNECAAASCDVNGQDGNCAILTPTNEGQPCADGTGVCRDGACADTGGGTYLVFMAMDGEQTDQPPSGPTQASMDPDSTAQLMVWMDSVKPDEGLEAHQIILPYEATPLGDACGTLTYVDIDPGLGGGDSIYLDTSRADWLFVNSLSDTAPVYTEQENSNYFGMFYATVPGRSIIPPPGVSYLCEFDVASSRDACGLFEIKFRRPPEAPPQTAIFAPLGAKFIVEEFQTLIVDLGPCTNPCNKQQPLFSIPPDGSIDPSGAPGPDGIGGTDTITVVFSGPSVVEPADFSFDVTAGTAPIVDSLRGDATAVELLLDRPIPAGACTTLTHMASGWVSQIRSLPGDVNGDAITTPIDILALIDHLNGITQPPLPDWQCDIDRSGACNGLDILQLIDLLNGADDSMAWNGVEAPLCP